MHLLTKGNRLTSFTKGTAKKNTRPKEPQVACSLLKVTGWVDTSFNSALHCFLRPVYTFVLSVCVEFERILILFGIIWNIRPEA